MDPRWTIAVLMAVVLWSTPAYGDGPTIEDVDLSGVWEADFVNTSIARLAVIGRFTMKTRGVLAVEMNQTGQRVEMTTRVCSLEMETSLPMADTVMPDLFVDSLPEQQRTAHIFTGEEGLSFSVDRIWNTVGIRLSDPASQSLPEDAEDPRIFDQDGDGNPGATIRVEGIVDGDIYVIQRGWEEWRGHLVDEDRIEGHILWMTDQEVLGASNRILRRQPNASAHPDERENTFELRRIRQQPPC